MGAEVVVPLLLTAVSAGTSMYNTSQTRKRANSELEARLMNQSARQREADVEVQKLISETEASNPEAQSAKSLAQYTEQLQRNLGNQSSGITGIAGASQAYKSQAGQDAMGVSRYGDMLSGLMSRIDGAVRQREDEAYRRGDTASAIQGISRNSSGDDFLSQLRLDGIRENPWLTALSQTMAGAASTYGSGAGGGTAGVKKTKANTYRKGGF